MMPAFSRTLQASEQRKYSLEALYDLEHDVGLEFGMSLHGEDGQVPQLDAGRVAGGRSIWSKADKALDAAVGGRSEHGLISAWVAFARVR